MNLPYIYHFLLALIFSLITSPCIGHWEENRKKSALPSAREGAAPFVPSFFVGFIMMINSGSLYSFIIKHTQSRYGKNFSHKQWDTQVSGSFSSIKETPFAQNWRENSKSP